MPSYSGLTPGEQKQAEELEAACSLLGVGLSYVICTKNKQRQKVYQSFVFNSSAVDFANCTTDMFIGCLIDKTLARAVELAKEAAK